MFSVAGAQGPQVEPVKASCRTRRAVSVGKDSPVSSASPESLLEVSGWGSGPCEEQAIRQVKLTRSGRKCMKKLPCHPSTTSLGGLDPADVHPTVSDSPEFTVLLHGKSASSLKQVSCEVDPTSSRFLSCAVNRQAREVGGRAEVVETGTPGHAIGFKMRTRGVRGGHDVVG